MGKKSNDHELSLRVNQVEEWLSDGLSRWEIVRNGSIEWSVSSRQVDDYIAMAKKMWKEIRKKDAEHFLDEAEAVRKRLYKRCILKKDNRTALACRDSLDKIRGILKEDKSSPFIFSFDADSLSPDAKKRIDEELSIVFGKKK